MKLKLKMKLSLLVIAIMTVVVAGIAMLLLHEGIDTLIKEVSRFKVE